MKRFHLTQFDNNGQHHIVAEGCLFSNGKIVLMGDRAEMRFEDWGALEDYLEGTVRVEWVDE